MEIVFEEKEIRFINGNSLKVLKDLPPNSFDACITDPPYNVSGYDNKKKIGWLKSNKYWTEEKDFTVVNEEWDKFSNEEYEEFTEEWLKLISNLVKPNGNILIFGTYHNIFLIGYLLRKLKKKIVNSIVWYKRNAFPNITQRMLCESTEYIIWATNNDSKNAKNWVFNYELLKKMNSNKQMRNVWDIPYIFKKEEKIFGKHPTQKPSTIIDRLVKGFTNEGDSIIDPFMGSGTIPLICLANKRRATGIEISEKYFTDAKKRLQNFSFISEYPVDGESNVK